MWDGSKVFGWVKACTGIGGGGAAAWPDPLVIGGFQDLERAELLARVKGC